MKLQIKTNHAWEYVFCYSETRAIIITKDSKKALSGQHAFDFFAQKFANYEFRLTK